MTAAWSTLVACLLLLLLPTLSVAAPAVAQLLSGMAGVGEAAGSYRAAARHSLGSLLAVYQVASRMCKQWSSL